MIVQKQIHDDDPRYLDLEKFLDQIKDEQGIGLVALQKAQEIFSFVPLEVHKFIAKKTGIPLAELYGITTFYSQFNIQKQGRHHIQICMGTACYVRGAQQVLDKVSETLSVEVGQTTQDGLFTLTAARCLGCCGLAPVMMIDDDVYANLINLDEIPQILESYLHIDEAELDTKLYQDVPTTSREVLQ